MRSPTLYRLALEGKYESIPVHVQNFPNDILWTDHQGCTALHVMCQARDVDRPSITTPLLAAVQSILEEKPSLVAHRNHATCTPLHYATKKRLVWGSGGEYHHGGANALVLMLLRYCPQAVSIGTKFGINSRKTPFHIACEANADIPVLRAMLLINPGLATEPCVKLDVYSVAENPLQLLWNSRDSNNSYRTPSHNIRNRTGTRGCQQSLTHDKMALLIRAAHYGTVDDNYHQKTSTSVRLLHAACSARCPQDYFLQLLSQYSEQIYELDERNLLPLHYAVLNASVDSQTYTQFVLEALLQQHPDAASVPDEDGRLPLHVALMDSKLTWHKGGIQELVLAYPGALRVQDPLHGLPPFLASAFHAIKSILHLSTTFELLRAAPDVMTGLVS